MLKDGKGASPEEGEHMRHLDDTSHRSPAKGNRFVSPSTVLSCEVLVFVVYIFTQGVRTTVADDEKHRR